MKYAIDNVVIEVTRRCNMCCDHCLRGDTQNKDMDLNHVRALFSHIDNINTLTITGGEPSLVPHIIKGIVEEARMAGVSVESFYIATNAKSVSDDFLRAVFDLYMYCDNKCDDECGCMLQISNDGHHDYVDDINIQKLRAFRFTSFRNNSRERLDEGFVGVIDQGRGGGLRCRSLKVYPFDIEDDRITEPEFYLSVYGDVFGACDLSYETQGILAYELGANVQDPKFTVRKAVEAWNRLTISSDSINDIIYSLERKEHELQEF